MFHLANTRFRWSRVVLAPLLVLLLSSCNPELDFPEEGPSRFQTGQTDVSATTSRKWIRGDRLKPQARSLLGEFCGPERDGLDPAVYRTETLIRALDRFAARRDTAAAAALDGELTTAFMRYGDDLVSGRVDPSSLSTEIYLELSETPLDSLMTSLVTQRSLESVRSVLAPSHPGYRRLEEALYNYRLLAEQGDWPQVPDGNLLKPDQRDPRVPALRARLAATNDLEPNSGGSDSVFDAELQKALAHFQRRHGLDVDSTLGPKTLEALNIPVEDRIRQIELALERWRWLPQKLGRRYVLVNIPAFDVTAYDDRGRTLSMKAVVGSRLEGQRTPVFSDRMEYIVFRPYWNVPEKITVDEIIPHIDEDDDYLAKNDYEIVNEDGDVVSRDKIDADDVESGKYRVRQRPGPANSLGLIKFVFPNRHNVYLHDTPADHLFDESERGFSHGCVRLEDPVGLAHFALGPQGWTRRQIEDAIQGERQHVKLAEPLPVYITYMTAFVEEDGTVAFRKDLYGFDETLDRALTEHVRKELARVDTTRSTCELIRRALDDV